MKLKVVLLMGLFVSGLCSGATSSTAKPQLEAVVKKLEANEYVFTEDGFAAVVSFLFSYSGFDGYLYKGHNYRLPGATSITPEPVAGLRFKVPEELGSINIEVTRSRHFESVVVARDKGDGEWECLPLEERGGFILAVLSSFCQVEYGSAVFESLLCLVNAAVARKVGDR